MTLAAGAHLGPYEILLPLGAGGMGEVWRARDTRLGREVAVKVLPPEVSSDRGRLSRFEKEARAASALNHPNIVTIYDIGSSNSTFYIAMERVEGNTLRELLIGGRLPIKKLLHVAAQIADGLAKAHEAGIVHRDLKPENVMVTRDGLVKILDFGLAKLTRAEPGSGEGSHTPTETGTSPGLVMGTAAYMSPEQASGEPVDFRSDQFSFGAILYEMATGERAFQRSNVPDTLSAILHHEPAILAETAPQTPVPLRWVTERCLAKEPADRYAATKDLARDLATVRDRLAEASGSVVPISAPVPRPRWRAAFLALVSLLAGAAIALVVSRRPAPEPPRYRRLTFHHGDVNGARFSADGQTIVYSASWTGHPSSQLFSTRPDATESTALALPPADILSISSAGTMAVGLNPSGALRTLAEASLAGGPPRPILEDVEDADWSPDGRNLAVIRRVNDRERLEYPIGKVLHEISHGYMTSPRFSPDGATIAFIESRLARDQGQSVSTVDLATGKETTLTMGWEFTFGMAWNPTTGELWFSSRELGGPGALALHAVSRSGRHRLVARGPDSLIVKDISRDGRVLLERGDYSQTTMCLPPGATKELDLSLHATSLVADLSNDGRTILLNEMESGSAASSIYLRRTEGSAAVRLGKGDGIALSPDGKWAVARSPKRDRLTLLPTGPGEPRVLPGEGLAYNDARFFPDGIRLLFSAAAPERPARLWIQNIVDGPPRPLTAEGFDIGPISPDGKWIAARSPNGEILHYSVDGGESRPIRGATTNDRAIRFDTAGQGLFLAVGDVPLRIDRLDLSTGRREPWKEIGPADTTSVPGIDIRLTPDGKSYAYSYFRGLGALFIVDGLR